MNPRCRLRAKRETDMKKQIAALSLSLALLAGLCSCTVEKPDLEAVSEQTESSEGSSAAATGNQKLTRKGSHIKGDLAEKFHVDAEIWSEAESLPTYYLSKINLTEDQLAERLMSSVEYDRKELDQGAVLFSNDKEKLAVDMSGIYARNPFSPSPNLTYALDKGKEYESVIKGYLTSLEPDSEDSHKAVAQVKEILDKLPIKYNDVFQVEELDFEYLNQLYSFNFMDSDHPDIPDETLAEYRITGDILLSSEGKGAELDKDFKFTEDDKCYFVTGRLMAGDHDIRNDELLNNSISAAVSSRGVEYLFIEDLYIPDNGSSDFPIITPEQAAEAVYAEYDTSSKKDNFDIYINEFNLNYTKVNESSDDGKPDASKAVIRPVWYLHMTITNHEEQYGTEFDAAVCADNGEILRSYYFGDYSDLDIPGSSEGEKGD